MTQSQIIIDHSALNGQSEHARQAANINAVRARLFNSKYKPKLKPVFEYRPKCLVTGIVFIPSRKTKAVIIQDYPKQNSELLLKQKLQRHISSNKITLGEILLGVSDKWGISLNDILSRRRNQLYMPPRFEFCYLARKQTTKSFPTIGTFLGGRDHTTAMYSVSKYEELQQIKKGVIAKPKKYRNINFDLIIDSAGCE